MQYRNRRLGRFNLAPQRFHIRKNARDLAARFKEPGHIFVKEFSSRGVFDGDGALVSIKERQVYCYAETRCNHIGVIARPQEADINLRKLLEDCRS